MIKNLVLIFCIVLTGCKGNSQEKKQATNSATENISIVKSKEEWKKELTDMQYYVLREAGTERAFTSDLLKEKRKGTYVCAACGTPLFKSEHKFDSGTGWPSFFEPAANTKVTTVVDLSSGMRRTEVRCGSCDAHLGHVFDDGPRPTGLRYCINSVALKLDSDS